MFLHNPETPLFHGFPFTPSKIIAYSARKIKFRLLYLEHITDCIVFLHKQCLKNGKSRPAVPDITGDCNSSSVMLKNSVSWYLQLTIFVCPHSSLATVIVSIYHASIPTAYVVSTSFFQSINTYIYIYCMEVKNIPPWSPSIHETTLVLREPGRDFLGWMESEGL